MLFDTEFLNLLANKYGPLGLELILLIVGCLVLQLLAPVVQGTLEARFRFPTIAKYVDALFRLGFPIALAFWFIAIVARFIG